MVISLLLMGSTLLSLYYLVQLVHLRKNIIIILIEVVDIIIQKALFNLQNLRGKKVRES